jgi:patatin-like phospholipase/acyl hydrolase
MKTLALQGGGCLGKGQAVALVELEARAGRPLYQVFGLVGGTSVGSIIGGPLACGLPMAQVDNFFNLDAPVIFKASILNKIGQIWGPKYSATPLETALQKMMGNLTLADCKTNFVATSYDFATDRLVFFKSYEKSWSDDNCVVIGPDSKMLMWQVLRASSAAQSYFPAFKFEKMILMDGGNTGDNAPDLLVLAEGLRFASIQDTKMLSVGAGNSKWKVNARSMISPSILWAGLKTITITFSAGETNAVILTGKNLGDNYFRLVADLGAGYAIDDASPETFAAMTAAWKKAVKVNSSVYELFSN